MAKQFRQVLLVAMCFEAACGAAVDGICKSLVQKHGYQCKEYTVTTKDGYILSMQRIPHGLSSQSKIPRKKQPILLQHGNLMDGATWLMSSPDQSLAYILADNGFDVWISNTRGTRWSREHTSLQAYDPTYWNWSWDELVQYDLPSFSEFVHHHTGQKLHYVGHSLGTLIALAALSQGKPADLLKSAALLCPVAYLSHIPPPVRFGAVPLFGESSYWLAMPEFNIISTSTNPICKTPGVNCDSLMSIITGKNCCLNSSRVDFFLNNGLEPTSTKNMIHMAQMIQVSAIAKYDYGNFIQNMRHYGQIQPPKYEMSSIPMDFPLFFSYGGEDLLSNVQDVLILLDDLKSHDEDKLTVKFVKNYAHLDFIMAINAKQTVYDPIIEFFNRQSNP